MFTIMLNISRRAAVMTTAFLLCLTAALNFAQVQANKPNILVI